MSKIRHVLQLIAQGRSKLIIASQTGVSRNTLKKYLKEFERSGFSFEQVNALSDADLEAFFIKPPEKPLDPRLQTLFSLFAAMDKELKRKGVTRFLLWQEYRRTHPDGYVISQFKHYFAQWRAQVNPSMRMEHKAGDKLYVDFAGDRLTIIDQQSGEVQTVEVFVAVLEVAPAVYSTKTDPIPGILTPPEVFNVIKS